MTAGPLDLGLGAAALGLVLAALLGPGRRTPAMAFLGLGVVLSLIWLRLGAIDVALAEAALGTGLLSAILVTLALRRPGTPTGDTGRPGRSSRILHPVLGGLAGIALGAVVIRTWVRAEQSAPAWSEPVEAGLGTTGVEHPVTGVLLGFRAYDTLLESAVLMMAGVVVLSLARDGRPEVPDSPAETVPGTLHWGARLLAAPLLLLGLWLLFTGSTGPGGAFQSGAVLAGLLVLLRTARVPLQRWERRFLVPLLVTGVIAFIAAALLGPVTGGAWLDLGSSAVFAIVLSIEVLLTAGIAVGLYLLYLGLNDPSEIGQVRR